MYKKNRGNDVAAAYITTGLLYRQVFDDDGNDFVSIGLIAIKIIFERKIGFESCNQKI